MHRIWFHILYLLLCSVHFHLFYILFYSFAFCFLPHFLSEFKKKDVPCLFYSFELSLLDLASVFLSIPPSPSSLMNGSEVVLPEASGTECAVYQTVRRVAALLLHGAYVTCVLHACGQV